MSSEGAPKLFRRIFQGAYYLLVIGFVIVVGYSASVGAFTSPDSHEEAGGRDMTPDSAAGQKCFVDLAALHARLYTESHSFFKAIDSKGSEPEWAKTSNVWRHDLERAFQRCQLRKSKAMKPALRFAKDIERVHMAFDTGLRAFRNLAKKPVGRIRAVHEDVQSLSSLNDD